MNGFTFAVGVLGLACGTGPGDAPDVGRAGLPGTCGTVLVIPADVTLELDQVTGPHGPVIRLRFGRRSVRAPALRYFYRGNMFDAWAGPKGYNITLYPKEVIPGPLPRIGR
jgi:hypothetical protein